MTDYELKALLKGGKDFKRMHDDIKIFVRSKLPIRNSEKAIVEGMKTWYPKIPVAVIRKTVARLKSDYLYGYGNDIKSNQ